MSNGNLPSLPTTNEPSDTPYPDVPTANPPTEPPTITGYGSRYILTITALTGGHTTPSGTPTYPNFTYVVVRAVPDSGYSFDHWRYDDDYTINNNPIQIYMDKDHKLTAYFKEAESPAPPPDTEFENKYFLKSYKLSPMIQGDGSYKAAVPVQYNYPYGAFHEVKLAYVFVPDEWDWELSVSKNGVVVMTLPSGSSTVTLSANSNVETGSYTIQLKSTGYIPFRVIPETGVTAYATISLYVTNYPAGMNVLGIPELYIGPIGIIMIAAGAILLALTGRV